MSESQRVMLDTEGESGWEATGLILIGLFKLVVVLPVLLVVALVRRVARPRGQGRHSA